MLLSVIMFFFIPGIVAVGGILWLFTRKPEMIGRALDSRRVLVGLLLVTTILCYRLGFLFRLAWLFPLWLLILFALLSYWSLQFLYRHWYASRPLSAQLHAALEEEHPPAQLQRRLTRNLGPDLAPALWEALRAARRLEEMGKRKQVRDELEKMVALHSREAQRTLLQMADTLAEEIVDASPDRRQEAHRQLSAIREELLRMKKKVVRPLDGSTGQSARSLADTLRAQNEALDEVYRDQSEE